MKNFLKNLKLNETNVSMLLGIIVVIIVGGLLINYFRSVNRTGDTSSTETNVPSDQVTLAPKIEDLPSEYTIQKGETLWSVSEAVYGSGYNWMDVYNANKEVLGSNPNSIVEGTKINLPKVEAKQATAVPTETVDHTVVKGDSLWKILVQTCQNGFLWPQVAKNNNLANANLIEVGQVLKISCR